jgi:hypothetical protein
MNFVANELKELLAPLSRIVSTKDTTENGDKFIFDGKKVYAFNGEIFACQELKTDFECAIPAETFFKMISKYGMNEIEIEIGEDDHLHIKKGRSDTEFAFETEFECPVATSKLQWTELPNDFVNGITFASYTTGNDFSDIRNVCIHVKGDVIESTDINRITQYYPEGDVSDEMFIPKTLIKYIGQINPVEYSLTEDWIYFRNANRVMMAFRITIVKEYYDLQSAIDNNIKGEKIKLPDKIVDALEKAEIVLSSQFEADRFVEIVAKKGQLTVKAIGGKGGKHVSKMKIDFEGEVKFEINPRSMIEMMINGNELILSENSLVMETEYATLMSSLMVN